MRLLVTGSRGFIGRYVVALARRRAAEIVQWHDDVRDLSKCHEPVDVVLHLAAVSRYDQFTAASHESYATNVVGTAAVLNYCSRVGARCVLTSTSAVYRPSGSAGPVTEDATIGPLSDYGISKWLAESLCYQQAQDAGVASTVLRLFNVYGPGQHASFLVPYVVQCLQEKRPMFLRMPEGLRDFVYVEDVVEALFKAARLQNPGIKVFNIGSGQACRVQEMVETAERVFGRAVAVESAAVHPDEIDAMVANISRARDELGWTPVYELEAGLVAMRDYGESRG